MPIIDRINLKTRIGVLSEAEDDPEVQADIYSRCKVDTEFFFEYFAWAYDPRAGEVRPANDGTSSRGVPYGKL